METSHIETPVWKTKEGEIPIYMLSDKHLQKAYNSAEYRYLKYRNLSTSSAAKAALLEKLIQQLEAEASKRNIPLISLSLKEKESSEILYKVELVEGI